MTEKKQFTVRLNAGLIEAIDEFKELLEENGEVVKTDKQILESLLEAANAKYRPFKDNSDKAKKLQAENEELKKQLSALTAGKEKINEYLSKLREENTKLHQELSHINNLTGEIIIKKSDIPKVADALIKRYLKDEKTRKIFEKENDKGTFDGYIDKITGDNELENTRKLLLGTFVRSALGRPLPAVVANRKIIDKIKEQKNGIL